MPTQIKRSGLDRTRPLLFASLAQSVEHAAVNRRVVGSSPTGGASFSAFTATAFRDGEALKSLKSVWIGSKVGPLAQLVRAAGS